mgnify:FL=1
MMEAFVERDWIPHATHDEVVHNYGKLKSSKFNIAVKDGENISTEYSFMLYNNLALKGIIANINEDSDIYKRKVTRCDNIDKNMYYSHGMFNGYLEYAPVYSMHIFCHEKEKI